MPEREGTPDIHAAAALELVRAENEYRSAMVGPVSPDALQLLQTVPRGTGRPGPPGYPDQVTNRPASQRVRSAALLQRGQPEFELADQADRKSVV